MDLFVHSDSEDRMSLALEIFVIYVRGAQRNIVQLNSMSTSALKALKLESVPTLLRQTTEIIEGKEVQKQM